MLPMRILFGFSADRSIPQRASSTIFIVILLLFFWIFTSAPFLEANLLSIPPALLISHPIRTTLNPNLYSTPGVSP